MLQFDTGRSLKQRFAMPTARTRNSAGLALFAAFLLAVAALSSVSAESLTRNAITGRVSDAESGESLIGANIKFVNKFGGAIADSLGEFSLVNLKDGVYLLQISHIGYETFITDSLRLSGNETIDLNILLEKKPVSIKGITVTPGQFSIMGDEPVAAQILSRDVIETRPQLSEDLFRAVQRLPGIAYNDFSAKFNVRGGEQDEVLINIDGMEIYEPFHLKDVDGGVISVVDIAAVEGVDLMAGGYPANYGDRMSGVFNIKSKTPSTDSKRVSVGLSLMNARFLSEGTFADRKGAWLVSGRRGYLDLVMKIAGQDDELLPRYYDLFGKVRYRLTNTQSLTASVLRADDQLEYIGQQDEDANNIGDTLISAYGSTYLWLTLDSYLSSSVVGKTIASVGRVSHERGGQTFDEVITAVESRVNDERSFDLVGLKTDWEYEANSNFLVKAGLDYKHVSADYDYRGYRFNYNPPGIDSNRVVISPAGDKISGYLSNRIRLARYLTAEAGVRYDYTSYSEDGHTSPRVNLAFNLSRNTSLRLGWGHFYQVQRADEINVQDGETEFQEAEKAEHFVVAFDHNFETGENLRLNVFYKEYSNLKPAYRNTFGELVSFPELEEDRVRVTFNGKTSKGIELYVRKDIGEKISWWFSYSLAYVRDDIHSLYYFNEDIAVNYDKEFRFPYDQQHTIYLDLNYRLSSNWQFNVAWQYHTGWPYTPVYLVSRVIDGSPVYYLEAGEPWKAKHEPFKRLDLRLNRKFFTSRGTITAFVEVINVLGAENIRNYEYVLVSNDGVLSVEKTTEKWFGTMPSFGVTYNIHF